MMKAERRVVAEHGSSSLEALLARASAQDLLARYAYSVDAGDFGQTADCFSDAGVLEIDGFGALHGRAEIEAYLSRRIPRDNPPRHFVTNTRFLEVGTVAIAAESYFLRLHNQGLQHWGLYLDRIVPVGDRWLFGHRRVTVERELSMPPGAVR